MGISGAADLCSPLFSGSINQMAQAMPEAQSHARPAISEIHVLLLARSGVPLKQIPTGTLCHLEAAMVQNAVTSSGWDVGQLDFLFIENVGNLVCPSSYDLGEDLRFVLLSVTEGEDKPLKYPTIFNSADIAVITKMDISAAVEFDEKTANQNIQAVRPGMEVFKVSAKTGEGMNVYLEFLEQRKASSRAVTTV
jgi:hydrogenase nickel incorporation protein HypB